MSDIFPTNKGMVLGYVACHSSGAPVETGSSGKGQTAKLYRSIGAAKRACTRGGYVIRVYQFDAPSIVWCRPLKDAL